jgi:hypothetical protein
MKSGRKDQVIETMASDNPEKSQIYIGMENGNKNS